MKDCTWWGGKKRRFSDAVKKVGIEKGGIQVLCKEGQTYKLFISNNDIIMHNNGRIGMNAMGEKGEK